jgi:WD40 repeat protein
LGEEIQIHNVGTKEVTTLGKHKRSPVIKIQYSLDQRRLYSFDEMAVKIWDVRKRSCIGTFLEDSYVSKMNIDPRNIRSLSVSPDETFFTIARMNGKLETYQLPSGNLIWEDDCRTFLNSVDISPDGKTLLVGGKQLVQLRDASKGPIIYTIDNVRPGGKEARFLSMGDTIAAGGEDRSVSMWRLEWELIYKERWFSKKRK